MLYILQNLNIIIYKNHKKLIKIQHYSVFIYLLKISLAKLLRVLLLNHSLECY